MEPFSPRRILAATDFSDLSTWALRHAVFWAQRCGAELTVLHVQEIVPVTGEPHMAHYIGQLMEANREIATERLAESVLLHVPTGVPVTQKLTMGSPPAVIQDEAESWGADLVVLGTHGRGGISRLLLGSVAERVLRLTRRPTLIVRQVPHPASGGAEAPRIRHVLCPVNDTAVARDAFAHAAAVARTFAARLTAVFAVEEKEATPESLRCAKERLCSWLPAEAGEEYELQPVIRHGDAAEQVITLARETAVDLVVIGAQHRRFVDTTVLGVTTVRVTRHAPCPVLVVPRASDT